MFNEQINKGAPLTVTPIELTGCFITITTCTSELAGTCPANIPGYPSSLQANPVRRGK